MEFILKKKLKFYTKESLKFVIMIIVAFGFISGILCVKYKAVYAVTIGTENVGYIENKEEFEQEIEDKVINYRAKNVDNVEIEEKPSYELVLVDRDEQTNEQQIIISMQKDMDITYKYYEIAVDDEIITSVDTNQDAQNIVDELKKDNEDVNIVINEKTTKNAEEIKTENVEVAKSNLNKKVNEIIEENESIIGEVQGIKLAAKPVEGTISSRYGVSSRIRSSTHTGLDIAASSGTPIQVVSDGVVTCASYSGAYGNLVKVDHGNGVETWYAHTSQMYVEPGQEVKAGDIIAAVGSTGNSTGPHLHFEIRIDGNHVDPQMYIYND